MASVGDSDVDYYHVGVTSCSGETDKRAACARAVTLSLLSLITLILCLYKVYRIHQGYKIEKYHLAVFYLASLECLVLFLHWVYFQEVELHFVALYLHVNQFLLICSFYSGLAVKVIRKPQLWYRGIIPAGALLFLYFSGVLLYSLVSIADNSTECRNPAWLLFSSSKLVLAQVFLWAAHYLIRTINASQTDAGYKALKKRPVWGLVIAFEVASIAGFTTDILFELVRPQEGCDRLLGDSTTGSYTVAVIILRSLTHLLPVWVMLHFLKPANTYQTSQAQRTLVSKFNEPSHNHNGRSGPAFLFDDFDFEIDPGEGLSQRLLTSHNNDYINAAELAADPAPQQQMLDDDW
eukprot:m.77746 g.77746  ORF g.77746 m.77746 type:complete len:350 (-) comp14483_c0_seq4:1641-2690(-)